MLDENKIFHVLKAQIFFKKRSQMRIFLNLICYI